MMLPSPCYISAPSETPQSGRREFLCQRATLLATLARLSGFSPVSLHAERLAGVFGNLKDPANRVFAYNCARTLVHVVSCHTDGRFWYLDDRTDPLQRVESGVWVARKGVRGRREAPWDGWLQLATRYGLEDEHQRLVAYKRGAS